MTKKTPRNAKTPDTTKDLEKLDADKIKSELTAEQMEQILIRARQAVKPIINREAAGEMVGEDIMNFKMKASD